MRLDRGWVGAHIPCCPIAPLGTMPRTGTPHPAPAAFCGEGRGDRRASGADALLRPVSTRVQGRVHGPVRLETDDLPTEVPLDVAFLRVWHRSVRATCDSSPFT